MTRALHRTNGFAIIELALVLIVIGILAAVFVPMAQVSHEDAMRTRDLESLETAEKALMGFIRVNQAVPCAVPDPISGNPIQIIPFGPLNPTTPCDPTTTLDLLGVRTTDARGRTFGFDVNDDLTEEGLAASGFTICEALANIISPLPSPPAPAPTLDPQVCEASNANTGNTACTPAVAPTMAFVLAGRGSDRCFNLENAHAGAANDPVCPAAVANNRIFENPTRLHSGTTDDGYYDDLVFTLTPFELAEALGCPAGGGGGAGFSYCPAGEKLVQVNNGYNSWLSIRVDGACYTSSAGTTASMGCQPEGTTLSVHSNQSCGPILISDTLANLDANNDGRADLVCDRSQNCDPR